MNKVPKPWAEKETYCQLIPNRDANNPDYDVLPRMGAFEISTVFDNVDILFFSKIMSRMWPDAAAVCDRLKAFAADTRTMNGAQLKAKYQTKGEHKPQARVSN